METLLGKTLDELKTLVSELGMRSFTAGQIARWLYEKRVTSIDEMTDLSKDARAQLAEQFVVGRKDPERKAVSADGTVKYVFPGNDSRSVEAVMIPDRDRATLCVSSQAGCRMGCKFCMTGQNGFNGNLTPGQIINQIFSVDNSADLTNIVFMGMGEPLDNIDNLLKAIEIITAPWGMAWSPRRITVSTVGANINALRQLLNLTQTHVAVSIHNPYPSEREAVMPAQKALPIHDVIKLLKSYDFSGQRRLSAEYIMWKGVNDDLAHADALARLLNGTHARVNLIRYHQTPLFAGQPSDQKTMELFRDRLNSLRVTSTIRASRGQDIDAACGMLAGKKETDKD